MGMYNGRKVLMAVKTVSVEPVTAELKVKCSSQAPEDTSVLWIKTNATPSKVIIDRSENYHIDYIHLPEPSYQMASGAVGTNIYLFGGGTGSGRSYAIRKFDTTSNTITTLTATLSKNLLSMASSVVGTNIYLFGGITTSYSNTIYKFDTTNETITTLTATLPLSGSYASSDTAVGTDIYIFGLYNGTVRNTIYKFDATSETVTTLTTTLPQNRTYMASGTIGTDIYLIGGSSNGSNRTSTIYKFDATSETITTLTATLQAFEAGCSVIGTDIYLFGGYVSSLLNTIYKFDATSETVTTLTTTLPQARYRMSAEAINTNVYLFGGYPATNEIYKFDTTNNTISAFPVLPTVTNNYLVLTSDNINGIPFTILKNNDVEINSYLVDAFLGDTNNEGEQITIAYYDEASNQWVDIN